MKYDFIISTTILECIAEYSKATSDEEKQGWLSQIKMWQEMRKKIKDKLKA